MASIENHPTVVEVRGRTPKSKPEPVDLDTLRNLCLECGADDAGVISIDRQELDDQRADILKFAPWTKTLVAFVCRMNREPVRSPARSIANLEFHHTADHTNEVAHRFVAALETRGIKAVNPSVGFPMEMDNFPGKIWVVSHKPVAVAAGLGQMGIHRNVIHPKFGNFILLGTVLIGESVVQQSVAVNFNPCLECKLCVAACPVGAISPEVDFNFSACYTHNYREFMGGFSDFTEKIAESRSRNDLRTKVDDSESASMWQSLSFGANYKAAYCMAVCPAGEDVISPWLDDRRQFLDETLRPLQDKQETVYAVKGSDAADWVRKRFPHKTLRTVRGNLHVRTIGNFLKLMSLQFQPGQSKGLSATYHFTFTGSEQRQATVTIRDQKLLVEDGHHGKPNLKIFADSRTWLGFLAREKNLAWALITRRIRLSGWPVWLIRFGKCFPS